MSRGLGDVYKRQVENEEDKDNEVAIEDTPTGEETKTETTSDTTKENDNDLDATNDDNNDTSAPIDLPTETDPAEQFSTLTKDVENELDDFDMVL